MESCCRLGTSRCTAAPSDQYDPKRYTAIKGKEYFVDGVLCFPVGPEREHGLKADTFYKSVFGPYFPTTAKIYCRCAHCTNLAFSRFTVTRGTIANDNIYVANQLAFVSTHGWLYDLVAQKATAYVSDWQGMEEEAILHAGDTHDKRVSREYAMADTISRGELGTEVWHGRRPTYPNIASIKTQENADPTKVPRIVVNLGVDASLQTAFLFGRLKKAMASEPLYLYTTSDEHKSAEFQFLAAPTQAGLDGVFRKLLNPETDYYLAYFSDDSTMVVRVDGALHWVDLDISKCDSSHRDGIFSALVRSTPRELRGDVERAIAQCDKNTMIRNPDDTRQYVVLRPRDRRMPSGWGGTTHLNNVGTISAATAIVEAGAVAVSDVIKAAARAGYLIKATRSRKPEEIQFLKNSVALDITGEYHAILNFGVYLRASGCCKGDLPGSGDWRPRARAFQKGLIQGMFPRCHCPALTAMRQNFADADITAPMQAFIDKTCKHKRSDEGRHFYFTNEAFFERYSLTPSQLLELTAMMAEMNVGTYHRCEATDKILEKDYGITGN